MAMPRKEDPMKYCEACGEQLMRKRYNGVLESRPNFLRRKYCNETCMAKGMTKENPTLGALYFRSRKLRGDHCEECGATERLHLHHVDMDPSNNAPSNRMTLCASCHQKWHWAHGRTKPRRQSVCKICGTPARKLDMCQKHYQRFKKYGDPCLTKRNTGSGFVLVRELPGSLSGPIHHDLQRA